MRGRVIGSVDQLNGLFRGLINLADTITYSRLRAVKVRLEVGQALLTVRIVGYFPRALVCEGAVLVAVNRGPWFLTQNSLPQFPS